MSRIKHTKPSPAIVIAVLALIAAVAGTAVAGPVATTSKDKLSKKEKQQTKKIAKKQAKKQIEKKASGLSVANATNASNVSGRTPFLIKLAAGQTQTIATNGAVSVEANCKVNGFDTARILAQTTQNGAALDGFDNFLSGNFNTGTAADARELLRNNGGAGVTDIDNDVDDGFVMAPDGKWLGIDGESTALGVNYAGAKCVLAGVVNASG